MYYPIFQLNEKQLRKQSTPIYFLPPLIAPDEEFRFVSEKFLPNIFPQRYLVSNYARVWDILNNRFVPFHCRTPNGNDYMIGHIYIFTDINTIYDKTVYLHRLVMMTFNYIPGCENLEVNHKDGIKLHNWLSNLEWTTHKENMVHAAENRLLKLGEERSESSFTNNEVHQICRMLEAGISQTEIAKCFGVSNKNINNIATGSRYRFISENYKLPPTRTPSKPLTPEVVHQICLSLQNQERIVDICSKLDVSRSVVNDIKFRRNYKKISSDYKF